MAIDLEAHRDRLLRELSQFQHELKRPRRYAILKVISAKLSIEHADEIRTKANLSRIPADD